MRWEDEAAGRVTIAAETGFRFGRYLPANHSWE